MCVRRVFLMSLFLPIGLIFSLAAPASAHSVLVSSDPEDGATVDDIENGITLTFNEPIREPAFVNVAADGGEPVSVDAEIDGSDVVAPLSGVVTEAAEVSVNYRVVSADGHPIEGTITFTYAPAQAPEPTAEPTSEVTAEPTAEPTPEPTAEPVPDSQDEDEGLPGWVIPAGIVVLVALGLAAWLAFGRRRDDAN